MNETCLQLGCEYNYACKCTLENPNIRIVNGSDTCFDYKQLQEEGDE